MRGGREVSTLYSRRQLFANAAIGASRVGSCPRAAADVAYLSGLISFDNLRSG